MDDNRTRLLIGKYYDGTATEAEERELSELLDRTTPPPGLEADWRTAQALLCARCPAMPPKLGSRIEYVIGGKTAEMRRLRGMRLAVGSAAAALILLSAGLWQWSAWNKARHEERVAECRRAAAETEQALTLLSAVLNEGLNEVGAVRITNNDNNNE